MLYMLCSKAIASVAGRYHKECSVENVLASLKMCFPGSDACVCSRGCVQAVEGRGRAMEKLLGAGSDSEAMDGRYLYCPSPLSLLLLLLLQSNPYSDTGSQ